MEFRHVSWKEWIRLAYLSPVIVAVIVVIVFTRVLHLRRVPTVYRYLVEVFPNAKTSTEICNDLDVSQDALATISEYLVMRDHIKVRLGYRAHKAYTLEDRYHLAFVAMSCYRAAGRQLHIPRAFLAQHDRQRSGACIEYVWTGKPMKLRLERQFSKVLSYLKRQPTAA